MTQEDREDQQAVAAFINEGGLDPEVRQQAQSHLLEPVSERLPARIKQ